MVSSAKSDIFAVFVFMMSFMKKLNKGGQETGALLNPSTDGFKSWEFAYEVGGKWVVRQEGLRDFYYFRRSIRTIILYRKPSCQTRSNVFSTSKKIAALQLLLFRLLLTRSTRFVSWAVVECLCRKCVTFKNGPILCLVCYLYIISRVFMNLQSRLHMYHWSIARFG